MFIVLAADKIHWHVVAAIPAGSAEKIIGALVFMMTGFGLGWVNAAADYSALPAKKVVRRGGDRLDDASARQSHRSSCSSSACCCAGSSASLSSAIGTDPIRALTTLLPTWFLVPFAIVAVLGLVGGAVLTSTRPAWRC